MLKIAASLGACAYCLVVLASKNTPTIVAAMLGTVSIAMTVVPVAALWMRPADVSSGESPGQGEGADPPIRFT